MFGQLKGSAAANNVKAVLNNEIKITPKDTLIFALSPRNLYHRGNYLFSEIDLAIDLCQRNSIKELFFIIAYQGLESNLELEGYSRIKALAEAEKAGRQCRYQCLRHLIKRYAGEANSAKRFLIFNWEDKKTAYDPCSEDIANRMASLIKSSVALTLDKQYDKDDKDYIEFRNNPKNEHRIAIHVVTLDAFLKHNQYIAIQEKIKTESGVQLRSLAALVARDRKKQTEYHSIKRVFGEDVSNIIQDYLGDNANIKSDKFFINAYQYLLHELPTFILYPDIFKSSGRVLIFYPSSYAKTSQAMFELVSSLITKFSKNIFLIDIKFIKMEMGKQQAITTPAIEKWLLGRISDELKSGLVSSFNQGHGRNVEFFPSPIASLPPPSGSPPVRGQVEFGDSKDVEDGFTLPATQTEKRPEESGLASTVSLVRN